MRKLYSRIFLGLLAMLCSFMSFAQISVTATAGTTGPTTYTTLKAAVDAINAGTHQGDINVSVTASTTEPAFITLAGSGKGSASYTSITIKPAAGTSPVISGQLNNPLLVLDSVRNLVIDGSNTAGGTTKDLTFQIMDSTGNTLFITNSSSNNTIKNSIFKGATPNSGVIIMGFAGGTATGGNDNNVFENNDVTKSTASPGVGIFNLGTAGKPNSNNIYRNNRISDFIVNGFRDGNGAAAPNDNGYSNNTLFEGNEIYHTSAAAAAATGSLQGIRLVHPTGVQNMVISKNRIHSLTSSSTTGTIMGIDLYDVGSVDVVNNTVILDNPTTSLRGIAQEAGAGAVVKVYHNTVLITGTTTSAASFAFLKNYTSTGDEVRNNMFINTRVASGTTKQYAISKTDNGTYTSNYNNLVSTGNANNVVGSITTGSTTDYATLANWQAGSSQDANSVSINPVFVSASDLHMDTNNNLSLDNLGTPIASVTTDIDGDPRSGTTPDLGADEFTASTTCTAPAITTQPTAQTICAGSALNLSVTATGSNLAYQWRLGGTDITGATSATYTVANAAAANGGSYDVVITNSCGTVTSTAVTVTVNPATAITTQPQSITVCQGNASFTVAATGANLTYQWMLGTTPIPGATTATVSVPVASVPVGTYTVNVVVTGTCGTVTSNNATLTVQNCTSVPNVDKDVTSMVMMPNLVRDVTTLRVTALRAMNMNFNVVDAQGRVVMTISKQVLTGKNDISLYLGQLAGGTYQLQGATDKGVTSTIRFVKQ